MGARYARAALVVEPKKLGQATRLVLVALALRVLDHDRENSPAGTYFAGRNRLLGDLAQMPTRTSLRHLTAHLTTLERLGLLERIGKPAPGKRAVYKLHLPVDNLPP
jgi:hypothetical protein